MIYVRTYSIWLTPCLIDRLIAWSIACHLHLWSECSSCQPPPPSTSSPCHSQRVILSVTYISFSHHALDQQIPAIAHPPALWLCCLAMKTQLLLNQATALVALVALLLVPIMCSVWFQTKFIEEMIVLVIILLLCVVVLMMCALHSQQAALDSWESWWRELWNSRGRLRMIMHPQTNGNKELSKLLVTPSPCSASEATAATSSKKTPKNTIRKRNT